ncbi:hypothetical protein [Streptomyces sp. NPDC059009]|uniref:hypothetical protein n=1 Tax=Streptomyces sp. NPDC059009 TaxID=3346694 RepID=UPI0036ABA582
MPSNGELGMYLVGELERAAAGVVELASRLHLLAVVRELDMLAGHGQVSLTGAEGGGSGETESAPVRLRATRPRGHGSSDIAGFRGIKSREQITRYLRDTPLTPCPLSPCR